MILVDQQRFIGSPVGLDALHRGFIGCLSPKIGTDGMFRFNRGRAKHPRKKQGVDSQPQHSRIIEKGAPEVHLTVGLEHTADLHHRAIDVQYMIQGSSQDNSIESVVPERQHFCQSNQQRKIRSIQCRDGINTYVVFKPHSFDVARQHKRATADIEHDFIPEMQELSKDLHIFPSPQRATG